MALILVEGPDCVGKTTLVERLAKTLKTRNFHTDTVEIIHRGRPTQHPLDEYALPLIGYRPDRRPHIICDRWHIGELVYPAVMGRESQLTPGVLRYIELILASRGALLVSITSTVERISNCIASRGDDYVTPAHATALRNGFLNATMDSILPVFSVDPDELGDANTIWSIIHEADLHASRAVTLQSYVTYVGSFTPDILLLGDTRNSENRVTDRRPAFMPYPNTSGAYLLDVIATGPKGVSVGIANACDVDNAQALYYDLGQPITVALGRHAQSMTTLWMNATAPHPQWWRRFKYHERDEYRALLFSQSPSWR